MTCQLAGTFYSSLKSRSFKAAMATPVGWSTPKRRMQRSAAWCAPGHMFFFIISFQSVQLSRKLTQRPLDMATESSTNSGSCITVKTRQWVFGSLRTSPWNSRCDAFWGWLPKKTAGSRTPLQSACYGMHARFHKHVWNMFELAWDEFLLTWFEAEDSLTLRIPVTFKKGAESGEGGHASKCPEKGTSVQLSF